MEDLPMDNSSNKSISITHENNNDWKEESMNLFEEYVPIYGKQNPHPAKMTESSTLVNLRPRDIQYMPPHILNISDTQYDAVVLATNSFRKVFTNHDGKRYSRGFFIGDGTGSGKGRTIAAIINEVSSMGPKKHVWITTSKDLYNDSCRDIKDIRIPGSSMGITNVFDEDIPISFITYSGLVSDKSYNELLKWMGDDFDGVIAFDECHKGKNLSTTNTKTAKRMCDLQDRYSNAKILYVSATGCSDIKHMAYLDRLGLWGYKESNFTTFKDFSDNMKRGGVCSGEMVAMYMKEEGLYISRHLSLQNITFETVEFEVSETNKAIYNECVYMFDDIRKKLFDVFKSKHKLHYWATVLRFFRCIITIFKVEHTKKLITDTLVDETMSVILNLQNTAESYQDNNIGDILSSPLHIISNYLDTLKNDDIIVPDTIHIPDTLKSLENPLDSLVNYFGEDNVSELTGRKHRFSSTSGKTKRTLTNNEDKDLFLTNKKRIAILSDASSTGISLHSTENIKRVHIILELPWSAEQFIQQCGRSHRTGETHKPKYKMVVSNIGCEQRFVYSIVKRLRMLGALTCGNRDTRLVMNNNINYDSKNTVGIIKNIIRSMESDEYETFKAAEKNDTVRVFMNKLMSLTINRQNSILSKLENELSTCITFDSDAIGDIKCKSSHITHRSNITDVIHYYEVSLDLSITYEDVQKHITEDGYIFVMNKLSKQHYLAQQDATTYRIHSPVKYNFARVPIDSFHQQYTKTTLESHKWYTKKSSKKISIISGNCFSVWAIVQKHLNKLNLPMYVKHLREHKIMGFVFPSHNIPQVQNMIKHHIC